MLFTGAGRTDDDALSRTRCPTHSAMATAIAEPASTRRRSLNRLILRCERAALAGRCKSSGATSVSLEIPWAEHAFDLMPNGLSGQIALYYTERFLAWALR